MRARVAGRRRRWASRRARTIYLADVSVTESPLLGELLTGIEVDRQGDDVSGSKFDQRRHIISTEVITRRVPVVMDKIYGEYVEVGTESVC